MLTGDGATRGPGAYPGTQRARRLRPGLRIYCIGDIHGRSDLLAQMRATIAADLRVRPCPEKLIICLGDYVDRGPDSAGVLEALSDASAFGAPLLLLRGNHEVMLMAFLRDPLELGSWRRFGGLETLASYGVSVNEAALGRGYEEAHQTFLARFPARHRLLLERLELSVSVDDYFFTHAGVRPGVALESQSERDLLWIRHDFLDHGGDFGKIVVHGHTPVASADVQTNRINIDTGAFATGRLTCLVLEGESHHFLTTHM